MAVNAEPSPHFRALSLGHAPLSKLTVSALSWMEPVNYCSTYKAITVFMTMCSHFQRL